MEDVRSKERSKDGGLTGVVVIFENKRPPLGKLANSLRTGRTQKCPKSPMDGGIYVRL